MGEQDRIGVRELTPRDAGAYRDLMLQAYGQHPDAFTSSVAEREALPLSWWQARLGDGARAASLVLGADRQGALAGCVGVQFQLRDKVVHKCLLFGMYVLPQARRTGMGEALVVAAKAAAVSRPELRAMYLTVTQGNQAAEDLYSRCGFKVFGVEPMAVSVNNQFVSKVHMWCDLRNDS